MDDQYGRIGRLDEQTLGYYRRVEQTLNEGFDKQEDDKELFMNNVFKTLLTEALSVSQNQTASRIVEQLLQEASLDQLSSFATTISKDWELACTDRFASHVTQTLVSQLGVRFAAKQHSDDAFDMLMELYSFLMSNLAFHMQNTYTSHIVRVMLEALGGVRVSEDIIRSRIARHGKGGEHKEAVTDTKPNKRFECLLVEICDKVTSLNKIKDHIMNHLSNPVLQTMLLVLYATDQEKCQTVCQTFVNTTKIFSCGEDVSEDEDHESKVRLPELVQHEIGSHFIEQILNVVKDDLLEEIVQDHLLNKVLAMAVHPTANFVLQKIIKHCQSTEQFECIFKKLSHHLESVLCLNHNQVIVCLAEGCVKHGTKQDKLVKALMKSFHCYSPDERQIKCVPLFASLTAYETFYKIPSDDEAQDSDSDQEKEIKYPELTKINLHGSLLLQQLLKFGNPKLVVTSLLQMKTSELRLMACDPCGSHIIEAFLKSSTIGEKSHDVLYQKLKILYCDLACNKNGSRTMDTLFNTAPVRHKFTIAEELVKHESKIRGNQFGRILWYHYYLGHFQRDRNQWKQRQITEVKKRKLFQEMFAEDSNKAKKRKTTATEGIDNNTLLLEVPNSDHSSAIDDIFTKTNTSKSDKKSKKHKEKKSVEYDKIEEDRADLVEELVSTKAAKKSKKKKK